MLSDIHNTDNDLAVSTFHDITNQGYRYILCYGNKQITYSTTVEQHEKLINALRPLYTIIEKDRLGSEPCKVQLQTGLTQPIIIRYELMPKLRGGSLFSRIMNKIIGVIFKIFDPIVKPIRAIVNCILLLVKWVLYIIAAFTWIIKLHVWFFLVFLPSLPMDILALAKNLSYLLYDAVLGTSMTYIRKGVNKLGHMTLGAVGAGWDNAEDSKPGPQNRDNKPCQPGYKCYRTAEGTVPFSVIIATVLCPPVGVFMEYGVSGWFKILIGALLTLVFYFPGLIYALILIYC